MIDREKVIKGLEHCKLYNKVNCDKCPYDYNGRGEGKSECTAELTSDVIAMLKEQTEIVRCKDCKYRGNSEKCVLAAISEEKDFPLFMLDNRGNWFCADGERKD